MEKLLKTKKPRLVADSTINNTGGRGGGCIKQNDDWKFKSYKGTNLGYDMMCESVNSDQEEKEGDAIKGNRIINLKNLITNIDNVLVCKECEQERELQIKLEEEKDVEKFIDYVEDYFKLTPPDKQKGVREIYEDFKKQTSHRQTTSHHDSFCMSISKHRNGLASTTECKCDKKNKTNASVTIIFLFIFLSKPIIIIVSPATLHPYGTLSTSNGSSVCN